MTGRGKAILVGRIANTVVPKSLTEFRKDEDSPSFSPLHLGLPKFEFR